MTEIQQAFPGELIEVVKAGNISRVKELLEMGEDPNQRDGGGDPCIKLAVTKKSKEIIQLLLDHGADIDVANYSGMTSLIQTMLMRDHDMMHFLIERGASPDKKNSGHFSALEWAHGAANFQNLKEDFKLLRNAPEIRRQYLEIKAVEDAARKKVEDSHTNASTNQDIARSKRPTTTVRKRPVV